MKVHRVSSFEGFNPVKISIDVESLEELQELYFLFNWRPLCDVLGKIDHALIRDALAEPMRDKNHEELVERVLEQVVNQYPKGFVKK